MKDMDLRQSVLDELEFEPSIDAADIGVTAENAAITLTGHVQSYVQKIAAERAVWRVKGVKGLAQRIEVRLPGDSRINDDELAERALNVLSWASSGLRDTVKVRVANGWITLTGRVKWNYQRTMAESEVRKLTGVVGVTNNIELVPSVQAVDVKTRIADALKRHAEVEASRIRIDVRDGGKVQIEGQVDNWDERRAVERAVWSVTGVSAVDDRVTIS